MNRADASSAEVLVLGAGIVGLSVALRLQRAGRSVCLVDHGAPGEGTSFGNAGIFANYATLPVITRQALLSLPREMIGKQRAVAVRNHYWPRMIGFGMSAVSAVREAAAERHHQALCRLIKQGEPAWLENIDLAKARHLLIENGCLSVYRDAALWASVRDGALPMRQADGVNCQALSPEEIGELEPALPSESLAGGIHFPDTRHLTNPLALSQALFAAFQQAGGRFQSATVRGIGERIDGNIHVVVEDGDIKAPEVVMTLGVSSAHMLRSLGLNVPLVSERGYHVVLKVDGLELQRPVGWLDKYFYATPMADGIRLAGTSEFSRPDAEPDERFWQRLTGWAEWLFGKPVIVQQKWFGSRATVPDCVPLIGAVPGHEGLYVGTGHGHLGLTLSGVTGELLTQRMVEGRDIDAAYDPGRFGTR